MQSDAVLPHTRLPRFRRATEPPAFRLTDQDVEIIRLLARHRFLRSTHIAAFVGRSLDRTNDRLCRLYHGGYLDRPRAQLDYYPVSGSAPMVYALADRGARLLAEHGDKGRGNIEWSRKNHETGRPFIEHQLAIMDFYVALQLATRERTDVSLIHPEELIASLPAEARQRRNPCALSATLVHEGGSYDVGVVPDLAFGLRFTDGSRRCFLVEIDRGTMPISRIDIRQTSFERKVRVYLTAQARGQHVSRFGWKTFRVLTVTTDERRLAAMVEATRVAQVENSLGAALFLFATRYALAPLSPLSHVWHSGEARVVALV